MNIIELTNSYVITQDGNKRSGYDNNISGRQRLFEDATPKVVDEIMAIWGDAPSVEDILPSEIKP